MRDDALATQAERRIYLIRGEKVIPRRGGIRRALPYAVVEKGAAILSTGLRSPRAALVNIAIMRAFVPLSEMLLSNADPARKLTELGKKYDVQCKIAFDATRELMVPPEKPGRRIGFHS